MTRQWRRTTLHERLRRDAVIWRFLATCAVLGFSGSAATAANLTEVDIREAILDPSQYSQAELDEMDLNSDGQVDVADLVMKISRSGRTAASFDLQGESELTVEESAGSFTIPIKLSEKYTGTLTFETRGSAEAGSDYTIASQSGPGAYGSITVSDSVQPAIEVQVAADNEAEGAETLVVVLHDRSDVPGVDNGNVTVPPSVVVVKIVDGRFGSYSGSLMFESESGLPSQAVSFHVDDRAGSPMAYFQTEGEGVLPASFEVPVAVTETEPFLSFTSPASGGFASKLGGRTVGWTLSFQPLELREGLLAAPFSLTYSSGLKASSKEVTLAGEMHMTKVSGN